ncbi:MAG TPA: carbohydrate kinase, partial [Candidatus Glassbacteria bacterium]|nr:carbohydrate kinase [Candidatus Glassbacteria bacterium]
LESLGALGMRLYLASGTDQEDVVQEAGRLGYAGCFDGGIYGSVGDITKFSKKKLIAGIISEHGLEGPELCTFGDGPVEIAETRRVGGLTVGIASDEVRGWGINLAKRDRLIKAGADIIVPDFTQGQALLDYLQGKL